MSAEHPRVCGENNWFPTKIISTKGTSPRMRGKQDFLLLSAGEDRNIPAYAGKTWFCLPNVPNLPEHPRVCGENVFTRSTAFLTPGTSPRMRGKLRPHPTALGNARNIPAYAGKTSLRTVRYTPHQEHPRVCGENVNIGLGNFCDRGTSPRMRGKLLISVMQWRGKRNIPAYAGKTARL